MRILDKYITKRLSSVYLFILLVFIGLYFVIDAFSTLSDVLKNKPPFFILIQYYIQSLPLIIIRVSPIALLISALYTFGELNKSNEIISIRVSGLSVLRISFPVIFIAFLLSVVIFSLQENVLIKSEKKVTDIKMKFIKKKLDNAAEEKNLAFVSGNKILFVEKFSPKDKILYNVMIFEKGKKERIERKITAKKVIYKDGVWIAKDIIEYILDQGGNIVGLPLMSDTKKIDLNEEPRDLIFKKSKFSSLLNLRREINSLKRIGASEKLSNLIIDYYQKIAEPFSHLFLVIGILPIALEVKKRKVALSSLGIGFIFGFGYYAISSFAIALGKSGIILPIFSAWLAPLFFITVGVSGLLLIR